MIRKVYTQGHAEMRLAILARTHGSRYALFAGVLLSHTGWALYPVLARYLQSQFHLPSFSLLAFSTTLPALIVLFLEQPNLRQVVHHPIFRAFSLAVVLRAITNVLAPRFTLAVYVQLINLMTPWAVALLNLIAYRETAPRYTGRTALIGTVGAVLILSQRMTSQGQVHTLTASDVIGLVLALISTFSLAWYMVLVRRAGVHKQWGVSEILASQLLIIVLVNWPLAVLVDATWEPWLHLPWSGVVAFLTLSLVVLYGANRLQISMLRALGARAVSAVMPWRMIVVLVASYFVLGEQFTSWTQVVGTVLVLLSLRWYLKAPPQTT